jgi:DNA replication protein DnaC
LEFFFDQTTENFLRGHVRAFQDWSGAPRVILYDNLKSCVLERRGNQIHFNPRLLELAADYHFAPRPCQVRAGNQKGRVERAIRYVRDSFWAGRVFTTLAECNRQALVWRDEVAHQRRWPDDSARSVAEAFAEEQPRLLPLPLHPFSTDRIEPVRSRKTIYVHFDLNDYSIPPEAVGRPLTLVASDIDVRVLDGAAEIARHTRSYDRQKSILDPAHEQALLRTKRKALHQTENPPPAKPLSCSVCWTCTACPLCAAPSGKRWNGTPRVPLRSPSCCAGILAPRPCRRWISAAIPRRRRWMSVPMTWRLTMNSPTPTTTTPSNSLPAQLEQIGLHALAGELDDFLARAAKQRWSPHQILEHLAQTEAAERAHRSLERRLRLSEIKKFKPMADFDWAWPTKIEREVIERALTLDFLPEARNLILVGANGLGKTMIAQNICHAAVLAGHSVLFRSAAALLEELHPQTPEGRHRKLRTYANVGLLCVDEVGYLSFDDKSADLLYEVINRRYERKSVILTTNRGFKEWNEVFPNAACIVTLLDRLLHHADVTVIEGDSYRKRESEQETAARRRRKK